MKPFLSRFPWISAALAALCAAASLGPAEALEYDRAGVATGEVWRLLSGQLVHWTPRMAAFDVCMLVGLGIWLELRGDRRLLAMALALGGGLTALAVHALSPDLMTYRGSSGLASTLFVLAAVRIVDTPDPGRRTLALAAVALFLAKAAFESLAGRTLFAGPLPPGVQVVPLVHLLGGLGGMVGMNGRWTNDRGSDSLWPVIRKLLRLSLITALFLLLGLAAPALRGDTPPVTELPVQVGKDVTPPEKLSGVAPMYTGMAFLAGLEGKVSVEAIINQQGDIENAKILKGLPLGLDQMALAAIKTWKFKPAIKDGKPVKVYYVLTVNFHTESRSYGPVFKKVIEKHPDFEKALHDRRYQEAAEIVDHWAAEQPGDAEIHLARAYVLLDQGRLSETWQEALAYPGDPYEIFLRLGAAAWKRGFENRVLSAAARAELVDLGLKAETKAMAARGDALEPMVFKVLLLQDKFELTADPQERQAVFKEGSELQKRATALEARGRLAPSETPPH